MTDTAIVLPEDDPHEFESAGDLIEWLHEDLDELPAPSVWDDIDAMEGGWCCYQAAGDGDPTYCTCWEPIYDLDVQHRPMVGVTPVERPSQCQDCAYRADSPEMGDYRADGLAGLPYGRGVFFCHDGIRRAVAYQHSGTGLVRPAGEGDYVPPIRMPGLDPVPYRADGLPAFICAGWAARHRHAGAPPIKRSTAPAIHFCH